MLPFHWRYQGHRAIVPSAAGKTSRALPSNTCQGEQAPLGFPSFGVMGGQDFNFCLAAAPFVADRPPTHFFVKKKFIPASGAEGATQKASSGFCCAHTFCGTGSIPHPGGSFFLYEKSVLRELDCLCGRNKEVYTDLIPPLFPPLKRRESKGGLASLCGARGRASRFSPDAQRS